MTRSLVAVSIALFAFGLSAADAPKNPAASSGAPVKAATATVTRPPATPEEQHIQDIILKLAQARWPNHLLLLDCQSVVPSASIGEIRKFVETSSRIQLWLARGSTDVRLSPTGLEGYKTSSDTNTVAVIAVIEAASGNESLVVSPDGRWAVVNIAPLAKGATADVVLKERVSRQVFRAVGTIFGVGYANDPFDVMKPITKVADLDTLGRNFGLETLPRLTEWAQKMGVVFANANSAHVLAKEGILPPRRKALWSRWEQKFQRNPATVLKALEIAEKDYIIAQPTDAKEE